MTNSITRIFGKLEQSEITLDIYLNHNNLIITGNNGSGKTRLLKALHQKATSTETPPPQSSGNIKPRYIDIESLEADKELLQEYEYDYQMRSIRYKKEKELEIMNQLNVELSNKTDTIDARNTKNKNILFFSANRSNNISSTNTIKCIDHTNKTNKNSIHSTNLGSFIEQHLLNLRMLKSFSITETNDLSLANDITLWFNKLENSLKFLLEDESTELHFNPKTLKFSIKQANDINFTFQDLSSGYFSVFEIYCDLLVRSEILKIPPNKMEGIAFIDEIDVHLHVSLQKKILPFLTSSFPRIQFIVTTHSPFVITSSNKTFVYDLTKKTLITEDLSNHSYSAIMEGLLGTKTNSLKLESEILEIANLLLSDTIDYVKLSSLVKKIEPNAIRLDPESRAYYLKGVCALLDMDLKHV